MKEEITKLNVLFRVHRKKFIDDEDSFLYQTPWMKWRPCPSWLGNFKFCVYEDKLTAPTQIRILADKLARLLPKGCSYNTIFVQKYEKGEEVRPHKDPKNNIGYTAIAVFGDYKGAQTVIGKGTRLTLKKGDALVLRCNHNNLNRPLHRVSVVTSGTRYSLIINQINKK